MFRQGLFFSCCHTIDADEDASNGKGEDEGIDIHLVIAS